MGLEAARETLAALADGAIADLAPFGEAGKILADAVRFAADRKS